MLKLLLLVVVAIHTALNMNLVWIKKNYIHLILYFNN